jgi:hypothetical protein
MTRSALALVLVFLLAAAPIAMAQTPPPPPPQGPSADDLDADGIPNHLDGCPTEGGAAANGGCPPDTDGDGVNDVRDACPTVAASTAGGCPIALDPGPPPTDTGTSEVVLPTATSVSSSSASIRMSGGALMLLGSPFHGGPTNMSVMTPKRLTIWLPKSIKVSGAPAKPCTQAFARTMNITTSKRCAKILAGRLGGNSDIHGWFAWAGPKQGAKQRLWLRGRSSGGDDDGALVGLGSGWIEPVRGGTKLTLELGQLGIDTRGLEVYSGAERTTAGRVRPLTGKCTGTFRMRLDTAQGSATKSFRC